MARKKKEKKSGFNATEDSPMLQNYKKGAIVGGLLGGMAGLLAGKRIILYTLIGAVAGGYISYKIYDDDYSNFSLRKFIQE